MSRCQTCCTTIENLNVSRRDNTILENISLHIHCNKVTAIVGPNGAGKTTLFKSMLGEVMYSGTIEIVGSHITGKKNKGRIGYVPQHLNFDTSTPLTVIEFFGVCLQKRPIWCGVSKEFRHKIQEALKDVDLEYAINRKIGMLSGGELQRVLLALAIMPVPDLLLLDEPISGVDASGQKIFYEKVQQLKKKYHMGIILITHDLENLPELCDDAILLNKKILYQGDPEEVRRLAKEVIV